MLLIAIFPGVSDSKLLNCDYNNDKGRQSFYNYKNHYLCSF